ncbi:hypothetical protein L7F22_011773 [Adiantum nelumboides]|nr:hypothetical protein [Adiantum nelumboides]
MLLNRALAEGLPPEWTMHTTVSIYEYGDPLDHGDYMIIMIGHTLAKLYGAVLEDEVVGVRLRACALLPLLKGVVKLPEDAASLERINFLATQRLNDNDKQVAAAAKAVSDAFKHTSVRCLGVEPGNENFAAQMEVEETDKQREEDEWIMLSKEEQEEQRKLDEMIQKMKLDGNKKLPLTSGASPAGGAAERASTVAPSKMPALARFKSTVASLSLGSTNQLGMSSGLTKQGVSTTSTMATGTMLSRSPPILRAQGAPISAGLAKAICLQQGIVTPLAPSSVIRTIPTSISMSAPAQVKSPAASSTEPTSETPPVSSGSSVPPSKGTLRPNLRTARKSS